MKTLSQDLQTTEQQGTVQDEFHQVKVMKRSKVITRKSRDTDMLTCISKLAVEAAIVTEDETLTCQAPIKFSQPQDLRRPEGVYSKLKIICRMTKPNGVTFTFQIMI